MGDAVEQHRAGSGRHVAVLPVETERRFTGIEYDTHGTQGEGSLFQTAQDQRTDAPAPTFRGNPHVTDLGLAQGAEMEPADIEDSLPAIDGPIVVPLLPTGGPDRTLPRVRKSIFMIFNNRLH